MSEAEKIAELERQVATLRAALQSLVMARVECVDGKPATHAWLGPESRKIIIDALEATETPCQPTPPKV